MKKKAEFTMPWILGFIIALFFFGVIAYIVLLSRNGIEGIFSIFGG